MRIAEFRVVLETKPISRASLNLNMNKKPSVPTSQFFTESQHGLASSAIQMEALESARASLKHFNQRRKTIEIFQQTERNRRNFANLEIEEHKRQPVVPTILRNDDSPIVLQELIKKSNKVFMRNRKPKVGSGVMFINELWNVKYEKKTRKSCRLDGTASKYADKPKTKSVERERERKESIAMLHQADVNAYPHTLLSNIMDAESPNPITLTNNSFDSDEQNIHQSQFMRKSSLPKLPAVPNFSKRQTICFQPSSTQSPSSSTRSLNLSPVRKPPQKLVSLKIYKDKDHDTQMSPLRTSHSSKQELRLRSLRSSFCPSSESPSPTAANTSRQGLYGRINSQIFTSSPNRRANPPNLVNLPITARESFRTKDFTEEKGQNINRLIEMCKVELEEKNSDSLYKNLVDQYSKKLPNRQRSLQSIKKDRVITQCQHSIKLGRDQVEGKLLQLQ